MSLVSTNMYYPGTAQPSLQSMVLWSLRSWVSHLANNYQIITGTATLVRSNNGLQDSPIALPLDIIFKHRQPFLPAMMGGQLLCINITLPGQWPQLRFLHPHLVKPVTVRFPGRRLREKRDDSLSSVLIDLVSAKVYLIYTHHLITPLLPPLMVHSNLWQ